MFHLPTLPPLVHSAFEILGLLAGAWVFRAQAASDPISSHARTIVIGACAVGAAIGAKAIAWLDAPVSLAAAFSQPWPDAVFHLMPGKGVVGGILGAWIAVEIAKKLAGIRLATGDRFVFPLIVGLMAGRLGCFFVGLADHTYGLPTALPWAVDFGDGVGRHPTQLYEILALATLGLALLFIRARRALPNGALFEGCMAGYCLFRLVIDGFKPVAHPYAGLNATQWLCVAALAYLASRWTASRRRRATTSLGAELSG